MPRKSRLISPTGIYHITLRSVNQHIIFEDSQDYEKFIYILSDCVEKYDIDLYAYCLMNNHIHLLIYSPPETLSSCFQSLGTRFARWYNNKYLRTGHLFQERFHSQVIDSDNYFLSALVYIHNNPVRANMCKYPSEYRWSSFNAYYGQKNSMLNLTYAYNIAGSKHALHYYFATADKDAVDAMFSECEQEYTHFVTDETAIAIFKSLTNISTLSEIDSMNRTDRNSNIRLLKEQHLTCKQVARIMNVSVSTVKRLCKK